MIDPNLIPILLPSPGTGCEDALLKPPRIDHDPYGAMTISLDYADEQGQPEISENDPPQRIIEVVVLKRRSWIIVDAELDVFLMTEAEYNEQVRSAMVPKPMLY
jgi:hypothetical protein